MTDERYHHQQEREKKENRDELVHVSQLTQAKGNAQDFMIKSARQWAIVSVCMSLFLIRNRCAAKLYSCFVLLNYKTILWR